MQFLFILNGYMTIFGLVVQGIGGLISAFEPEVGEPVEKFGLAATTFGAGRQIYKKKTGMMSP